MSSYVIRKYPDGTSYVELPQSTIIKGSLETTFRVNTYH